MSHKSIQTNVFKKDVGAKAYSACTKVAWRDRRYLWPLSGLLPLDCHHVSEAGSPFHKLSTSFYKLTVVDQALVTDGRRRLSH